MALKVTFENTQEFILSNTYQGVLLPGHGVYYVFVTGKLGEVTEGAGKTPQEAINDRYAGKLSANDKNIEIAAYFVFDKNPHKLRQYDNTLREYIDTQYKGGVIPFGACHLGNKIEGKNTEALIDFDVTQHLPTLIECVKSHHGISQYFNTKKPFKPRFGQKKAIDEIVDILLNKNKCLFSGYTSIGKTIVSLVSVLKYFREWDKKGFPNWKRGGLVLITTPISDTLISFMDDLDFVDVGATRSQKYSYMTKKDLKNTSLENITKRTDDGEVIFLLLTAQDLFYPPKDGGDYSDKIRPAYNDLTGKIDLWVRDEGHKFYRGERTSTLLDCLKASAILDLSATPYNFLDTYSKDTIVNRDLLWGSKHREYTKLPEIAIESYETPFAGLSDKIKAVYDVEEGYDPRKWLVRDDNGAYDMIEDIVETYDCKYVSTFPKDKNHLNVNLADKRVALDVYPAGEKDDSAADKYPDLAKTLNQRIKTRHFIDAWTLEKISDRKNISLEKCVDELLDKYQAVNILTCRKFTTGTNIPQISHINLFDKMSSPAELIQLIGRACRKVAGKNQVMLYNHCPGNKIELALGIAARKSADLSGESQVEYLQSIPFTKYPLNSTKPTVVTAEDIIFQVNDYYRSISSPKPNTNALLNALLEVPPSFFDTIDLKKLGKHKTQITSPNQIPVSDHNKSKVKHTIPSGVGVNPTSNVITQVKELLISIGIEMAWVSYTNKTYDPLEVLDTEEMKLMFDSYPLSIARSIIMNESVFKFFTKFLKEKKQAYNDRPFEEVHDYIFIDTDKKRKMGLVYVPINAANDMILDEEINREYNGGKRNFLVINALSGSIAYVLKKKYPDANIFCAEYYTWFKTHLKELISNCVVFDVDNINDKLTFSQYKDMKFDVVLTNPPYNSDKKTGNPNLRGQGNKNLWFDFTKLGFDIAKDNGILGLITPDGLFCGGDRFTDLLIGPKAKYDLLSVNYSVKEHFKGIGVDNILSWVGRKSLTNVMTTFNDRNSIDVKKIFKLISDPLVHDIYNTLSQSNVDKFNFDMTGQYNISGVESRLKKLGKDTSPAGDLSSSRTETHKYPVMCSGVIKYTSVKWDYVETPKLLIAQMKDIGKFKIVCDDLTIGDQSTLTHFCKSIDEAEELKSILDDPITRWIIEKGRLNGRLGGARLSILPKVHPSKVLTNEQLCYIDSQLDEE